MASGDETGSQCGLPPRWRLRAPTDPRHWRFAVALADALGARAVLPAYPLAPEFTVDDSFDELVLLVEEVAAQSPGGVVLAGDSAGGGYALALAEALA